MTHIVINHARLCSPVLTVCSRCCDTVQAHLVYAPQAVAGQPFVLNIALQSHCALLQRLEVTLKDSAGFVTSGKLFFASHVIHNMALLCMAYIQYQLIITNIWNSHLLLLMLSNCLIQADAGPSTVEFE